MKVKLNSKILIILLGVFLIGTMLFSVFAGPLLQSSNTQSNLDLPKTNIIDYQLDTKVKNAFMQYGVTIITFDYNLGCENCIAQKSTLEFFANEYKPNLNKPEITIEGIYGKIFLEELVDESLDKSKITITSIYGKDELTDANETGIVSSLCNLMVSPPVACALKT